MRMTEESVDDNVLRIDDLHERHPGLTEEGSRFYHQAACVCLDRHHEPPKGFDVDVDQERHQCCLLWQPANATARRTHKNELDTTECGGIRGESRLHRAIHAPGRCRKK